MSYDELKIGKLVQTVLKPLIISKATINEVMQMQNLEYSKSTFGIQYPLLLKTSSSVAEKHYYSELFTLYGETYRLCCEWFETATNNDRPYVEKWIQEHEEDTITTVCLDNKIVPQIGIAIGAEQYKGRTDLTVVEIPEGVTYIGRSAFSHCENLTEIVFPDSVEVIDDFAFAYCASLKNLKLPPALRCLGINAFTSCYNLESTNIPHRLLVLPFGCFNNCKNLKDIGSSDYLRVIMQRAFGGCESLSFFSLHNHMSLRYIDNGAFYGCKNLVFETLDYNIISTSHDVKTEEESVPGLEPLSFMVAKNAFGSTNLTIRAFPDSAGTRLAQELGAKIEYM